MTVRGEELVGRVCAEKLVGAQTFTILDEMDPILTGLAWTNPCERHARFSVKYWINRQELLGLIATSRSDHKSSQK
jgi:hypothetical protein